MGLGPVPVWRVARIIPSDMCTSLHSWQCQISLAVSEKKIAQRAYDKTVQGPQQIAEHAQHGTPVKDPVDIFWTHRSRFVHIAETTFLNSSMIFSF